MPNLFARQVDRVNAAENDRGAVLPLLGVLLLILLGVGALAVDASALSQQGQRLQNAADSAALAGVTEWSTSADEAATKAVVADLIAQNGLGSDSAISWTTEFVSATEVKVNITDSDPDAYLGDLVGGASDHVSRFAIAQFTACEPTCGSTIDVPEPLQPINYNGRGDGYRPLLVEGNVYAVRHHDNKIGCVDRATSEPCWPDIDRGLFDGGHYTMNVTNPYLYGSKIFYLGFEDSFWRRNDEYPSRGGQRQSGALYIGCWETKTDTRCGDTFVASGEGQGVLAGTDQGLYIFTNDRKVYCLNPSTMDECSDHTPGSDTAAASIDEWDATLISHRNSTFREHDGLIYTTLAYNGRHHLQCWDTANARPCTGFGTPEVNDLEDDSVHDVWYEGRLFFSRNSLGTPTAICSTGRDGADCFGLTSGTPATDPEDTLASFTSSWTLPSVRIQSAGQHTYHAQSNRTFFLSQTSVNQTYCWDWTSSSSCGELTHFEGGGPLPYGYWPTSECLFGLGHAKIFFTITPDMTSGCTQGTLRVNVDPCTCNEELLWPSINLRNGEGVEEFRIRVLNAAGDVIYPTPSTHPATPDWLDLAAGDVLDLTQVTDSFDQLTLEIVVDAVVGQDPWEDGNFPGLELVSPGFLPRLTE